MRLAADTSAFGCRTTDSFGHISTGIRRSSDKVVLFIRFRVASSLYLSGANLHM
eukprot:COSAG02_NODE_39494_length_416_cov_1.072555_1_plen_53_part_10